jgi:2-phospho-L-lactate guanylyltransferase
VQATVSSFDATRRAGTLLRDDGVVLTFDAQAFDAGDFRLLRPGQRVGVRLGDGGEVAAVTLPTT